MFLIGVIGGSAVNKEIYKKAFQTGALIAKKGGFVVCGGLSGVMEAACKGAKSEGGTTIGILPGKSKSAANPYVDIPVPTGIGEARNVVIVNTAAGFIAIDGKEGTLSEIAFALKQKKPVMGIDTFNIKGVVKCGSPEEAVKKLFGLIRKEGKG